MRQTAEEKFWGANKTVADRIARVPDLTERETNYALSFCPSGALFIALEKHQFSFRIMRAQSNAMAVLNRAPSAARIRFAAGLLFTSATDDVGDLRERLDRCSKEAEQIATELELALQARVQAGPTTKPSA